MIKLKNNLLFLTTTLFIFISCTYQTNNKNIIQNNIIDTAQYLNPIPPKDSFYSNIDIFENCLILEGDSMSIALNKERKTMQNVSELIAYLKINAKLFLDKQFYIIYRDDLSVKYIFDIITILKKANFKNYNSINLKSLIQLYEPEG